MADIERGTVVFFDFKKKTKKKEKEKEEKFNLSIADIGYRVSEIRQAAAEFEVRFSRLRRTVPKNHPLYWNPRARGHGLEFLYAERIYFFLNLIREHLGRIEDRMKKIGYTDLAKKIVDESIDFLLGEAGRKLDTLEVFYGYFKQQLPLEKKHG